MQRLHIYVGCYHDGNDPRPHFIGHTPAGGNLGCSVAAWCALPFAQSLIGQTLYVSDLRRDMQVYQVYLEPGNDPTLPPHDDEAFRITQGGRIVAVCREVVVEGTLAQDAPEMSVEERLRALGY